MIKGFPRERSITTSLNPYLSLTTLCLLIEGTVSDSLTGREGNKAWKEKEIPVHRVLSKW
jgi:hypothetical protein